MRSWIRTSSRTAAVTGAVVIALLVTCGSVWLAVSRSQTTGFADPALCDSPSWAQVTVAAHLSVQAAGVDTTQLVGVVDLKVPATLDIASDFLASSGSDEYRSAFQCVLDVADDNYDPTQWRTNPPEVVESGGIVSVHDSVQVGINNGPNLTCGLFRVDTIGFKAFKIQLDIPPALTNSHWTEVSVTTPPHWLSSAMPWPPDVVKDTETEWHPEHSKQSPAIQALLTADLRTAMVASTGRSPGNVASSADSWFDTVAVSVVLFIWLLVLVRRNRQDGPKSGKRPLHLWSAPVRLAARSAAWLWNNRKHANPMGYLVGVCIVLVSRSALSSVSDQVGFMPGDNFWALNWYLSVGVAVTLTVAGLICGLSWWAVLTVLIGQAATLGVIFVVTGGHLSVDKWELHSDVTTVAYAMCGFLAEFMLWVVLLTGTAALLWQRKRQPWLWLAAAAISTVLVIERLFTNLNYYAIFDWTMTPPKGAQHLIEDFQGLPLGLLNNTGTFQWMLLLLCVWAAVRTWLKPSLAVIGPIALLLFWVGPWGWDVTVWNWSLPLWIPLVLVAARVLRRLRRLPRQISATQTLEAYVDQMTIAKLRQQARDWQVHAKAETSHEKSRIENSAANSTHQRGPRLLARVATKSRFAFLWTPVLMRPRSGKDDRAAPNAVTELRATPTDILLAVGPNTSPWENMMAAMKIGAILGVPAAVGMTWLSFQAYPIPLPSLVESIISDVAGTYLWYVITYVVGAGVLGLLWQYLPGKRGPIRALWVCVAYSIYPLLSYLVPQVLGGFVTSEHLVDALVFTALMVIVGIVLDSQALSLSRNIWARPRSALLAAYGLQNMPAQLTFLVAQTAAILAIVSFLRNGGSAPAAPNIDPSILARLSANAPGP